jgi:hypothetical protein
MPSLECVFPTLQSAARRYKVYKVAANRFDGIIAAKKQLTDFLQPACSKGAARRKVMNTNASFDGYFVKN